MADNALDCTAQIRVYMSSWYAGMVYKLVFWPLSVPWMNPKHIRLPLFCYVDSRHGSTAQQYNKALF